jgi:hypothetical protein
MADTIGPVPSDPQSSAVSHPLDSGGSSQGLVILDFYEVLT